MATIQLAFAPKFMTVRSVAGAAAADNATVSDANYPLATFGFDPGAMVREILVFWQGTGVAPGDTLDLQLLHRDDATTGSGGWKLGESILSVPYDTPVRFRTDGSSFVGIRILAEAVVAGTGVIIKAAANPPLR